MTVHQILSTLLVFSSFACADDRLDQSYFGLEFQDSRGAVQISWIDPDAKWARKLNVGDVVLKAGNLAFTNATDLAEILQQQAEGTVVRFEVLSLRDKEPRTVSSRSELLRDAVVKRFNKDRDRVAKESVYLPKFQASRFHMAVTESVEGGKIGLKVRYFPKDRSAVAGGGLRFWDASRTSTTLTTSMDEYEIPNLSDQDKMKLPTLTSAQMRSLQATAYVEIGSDRTDELLSALQKPRSRIEAVGYHADGVIFQNRVRLSDSEIRNVESCLLLYELLVERQPKTSQEGNMAEQADSPLPPTTAMKKAEDGWKLWQAGEFAGKTHDGYYTDPDSSSQVKDFWSDGTYARVDDTNDGMFETIFAIKDEELRYIGTLEQPFIFRHIEKGEEKTVTEYLANLRKSTSG